MFVRAQHPLSKPCRCRRGTQVCNHRGAASCPAGCGGRGLRAGNAQTESNSRGSRSAATQPRPGVIGGSIDLPLTHPGELLSSLKAALQYVNVVQHVLQYAGLVPIFSTDMHAPAQNTRIDVSKI